MKNKIITISFVLVSLLSQMAGASSVEKGKELMKLMEVRKNFDASQEQVTSMAKQMIASQGLSEEESAKAMATIENSMKTSFNAMKEIDWETTFGEIYGSVFTEDELQGLIDFYKSPVGKKFIKKQPELTAATMQKMQDEMIKIMPKIQADVQKAIEEAKQ